MQAYNYLKGRVASDAPVVEFTHEAFPEPHAWFDMHEGIIGSYVANLAKFLIDAPAQGASCERLFKDFARFLTKTRNRLTQENLVKSTMIKHDLMEKYPEQHDKKNSPLHSKKNRFVSPDE